MTVIETGMEAPSPESIKKEAVQGNHLIHLPALEMVLMECPLFLSDYDTVFFASPRAVHAALKQLKTFNANVWAVGHTTARALKDNGISVFEEGNGEGAELMFEKIAMKKTIFPAKKIAWLSALETEVSLDFLRKKYALEIVHFPLYQTLFKKLNECEMKKIPLPRKWIFRSGKGVRSFFHWISPKDQVELLGKSTERVMLQLKEIHDPH